MKIKIKTSNCPWCDEFLALGDLYTDGMPTLATDGGKVVCEKYHYECYIRMLVGSVGHLRKMCSCYGGTAGDPPELSRRAAAAKAYRTWIEQREAYPDACEGTGFSNPLRHYE